MHPIIVLAGGEPKQLGVIYASFRSRSLVPILDRPLIDWLIAPLIRSGSYSVVVVSDDYKVKDYCAGKGCEFIAQKGSGVNAAICSGLRGSQVSSSDYVTIVYGDIFAVEDIVAAHVRAFERIGEPMVTLVTPYHRKDVFLIVDASVEENIVRGVGRGNYAFAGILTVEVSYLVDKVCREGKTVPDVIKELALAGKLYAHFWPSIWIDVDNPWEYSLACRLALELRAPRGIVVEEGANVSERAHLEPPVYIARGARVEPNAVIRGPAFIGRNTLVGVDTFVRESVVVHNSCVIGSFTEVKRTVILPKAFISSHCYIADSVVGEAAEVSAYTITLNVPYMRVPSIVRIAASIPLEKLKVGATIGAGYKTRPFDVLEPARVYS